MRTIIAGSRTFNDYDKLCTVMNSLPWVPTVIISGGARGADALGERYAREHSIHLEIYYADWDRFGKSAGYKRNEYMADVSEALVAFHVGNSNGTKHMIDIAKREGLLVKVWKGESI